jgi:hypothetical protein
VINPFTAEEIRLQLKKMAKKMAVDGNGIVVEMLQAAGLVFIEAITELFNEILCPRGPESGYWKESAMKVIFKKGDCKSLENYRPISILPILYKLFSRVLNERIKKHVDARQSHDQAGFRCNYGCDDHLFAVSMLRQRADEFQLPLWVAAVDFRKAFDSVEHEAVWSALERLDVPEVYIDVLKRLYSNQGATIVADRTSRRFRVERGTKQGDPISPSLFNSVLEVVMRDIKDSWSRRHFGIDVGVAERLTNLRFADDVLLVGSSLQQVSTMLQDLAAAAGEVGLELHPDKTKILANECGGRRGRPEEVELLFGSVKVLPLTENTLYLGRKLAFGNSDDTEINIGFQRDGQSL